MPASQHSGIWQRRRGDQAGVAAEALQQRSSTGWSPLALVGHQPAGVRTTSPGLSLERDSCCRCTHRQPPARSNTSAERLLHGSPSANHPRSEAVLGEHNFPRIFLESSIRIMTTASSARTAQPQSQRAEEGLGALRAGRAPARPALDK